MDFSTIASVGGYMAGGAAAAFGWLVKRSISQLDQKMSAHDAAIEKGKVEFADYRLHVAETYAPNASLEKAMDRFSASVDAVFRKLEQMDEKIERRLEGKADK